MAIALQEEQITPADALRQLLTRGEDGLIQLTDAASAAALFTLLDQIAALLPQLEASGVDLRAETARWQGLQERLLTRGARVLAAWQGATPLAAARQARNPTADLWWWWIDQRLAERRRARRRRAAGILLAVAAVIALAAFAVARLFPGDPTMRAAYRLRLEGESALSSGDLSGSADALRQAIQATPEDANLLILYGVVVQQMGDAAAAEQTWQQARELLGGAEAPFLAERGLAFLQAQQPEAALADLETAVALDPTSARTHLLLGSALETMGRVQEALAAYEQAATLAEAAGNSELVAVARVQAANLMQRMQFSPPTTPQP